LREPAFGRLSLVSEQMLGRSKCCAFAPDGSVSKASLFGVKWRRRGKAAPRSNVE